MLHPPARPGWALQQQAVGIGTSWHPTVPPDPPGFPSLSLPPDVLILLFTLAALLGWIGKGGGVHDHLAATRWGAPLAALLGGGS